MNKSGFVNTLMAVVLSLISLTAYTQDTARASRKPATPKPSGWQKPAAAAKPAATYQPTARTPYGTQPAVVNTDKSLNGQYQYLLTKVYNYQRPQLSAFYKNLMDSLRTERRKLKEAQQKLSAQGKAVENLQSDVSAKEQSLNESNSKADAISLLGVDVSKSTYNMIMWGLVIVFGIVATVVIIQSASARREARYRTKLYDELDEEYKSYKIKANEKEKKLARELQTERNKLDELLGRG
ncbi:hypothetical protein KHS38_18045 [Mucilaginibacter sp. Bleaf8]|uniref:hypothetical protein n=1 Tax=Mucilaginibacter sp. Bleaf8 TaxID=2834430 RepID=UPI001BCEA35F|nr:hypothetical protein [Mucilaginibacter sp. Bleaf8]MBS7566315.1 hypothetical protein [Mucilaginibacter sp. Bleaf8]